MARHRLSAQIERLRRTSGIRVSVRPAIMLMLVVVIGGNARVGTPLASAVSPEGPEAQIRAVLDAQVAAWNRGDVPAFMQGYWNSPDTEFVGSSGIVRGWQPVLDRYRKAYPDRAAMGHLDFSGLEIEVLSPDAALVVGHFRLERQSDSPSGVFTLIFRKFPEGWRIIHDHTSQVAAQAAVPASQH
jgi:ketosteroid isomerase-like protein